MTWKKSIDKVLRQLDNQQIYIDEDLEKFEIEVRPFYEPKIYIILGKEREIMTFNKAAYLNSAGILNPTQQIQGELDEKLLQLRNYQRQKNS